PPRSASAVSLPTNYFQPGYPQRAPQASMTEAGALASLEPKGRLRKTLLAPVETPTRNRRRRNRCTGLGGCMFQPALMPAPTGWLPILSAFHRQLPAQLGQPPNAPTREVRAAPGLIWPFETEFVRSQRSQR